jgi:hypothetical protein
MFGVAAFSATALPTVVPPVLHVVGAVADRKTVNVIDPVPPPETPFMPALIADAGTDVPAAVFAAAALSDMDKAGEASETTVLGIAAPHALCAGPLVVLSPGHVAYHQ